MISTVKLRKEQITVLPEVWPFPALLGKKQIYVKADLEMWRNVAHMKDSIRLPVPRIISLEIPSH